MILFTKNVQPNKCHHVFLDKMTPPKETILFFLTPTEKFKLNLNKQETNIYCIR